MSNNAKRVLDVGQCDPDHGSITRLLETRYQAVVVRTHGPQDTLDELKNGTFDLVLINRKLDADYTDGVEILKTIKADPRLAATPVMIVTNYQDHQQAAVALGAIPGFGKAQLSDPQTFERLDAVLSG